MTRLLFLAACFAGALATYDYGGGDKEANDKSAADMSSKNMNKGAEQKNAADMKSGYDTASVDASIAVLTSYKGGEAPVEQIAQPAMEKGMMHKVMVGGDAGLIFSPNTLTAKPGDMVEFTFMSMNHTVTQSTFPEPCKKMDGGADSGFLANPNNTITPPPTYMFQVKDDKAVWFYCKQKKPTSHCGKGMTFSINPTAEKSHELFTQMAIQQNGTDGGAPAAAVVSTPVAETMTTMPVGETNTPPPPAETAAPATTSAVAPPPPPASSAPPPEISASPPPPPPPPASSSSSYSPEPSQNLSADTNNNMNTNNMATGTGNVENGQCNCACLCGAAAFPEGAGVGMWGGWSGAVAT